MLPADELPHYNHADYKRWEGSWELIEGIPCAMTPSPTVQHQYISQKIARYLDEALDHCPKCTALLALDWVINDHTVVQPGNLVICHEPTGDFLTQAPALIFEILSPSTTQKDRVTKFRIYEQEGVPWYCLIDPENRVSKIYRLHEGQYVKQADVSQESHEFMLHCCRFNFNFSKIWPRNQN